MIINRDKRYVIVIIIDAFILLFFILSMIYISKIKKETSSGNPFELEEESDKNNYFKYNVSSNYPEKGYCICGKNTFLDYCNEELLNSGCKILNINKETKNLRKFSQCEEIQNKIINENIKLKDIFELKTDSIYPLISTLMGLNISIFILIILFFPLYENYMKNKVEEYKKFKEKESKNDSENCCKKAICFCCVCFLGLILLLGLLILIAIAILIILIISIIIFSIACGKYNSSDTSKYLEFLECTNVNKEGFYKFSSLDDLSSHFTALKIAQSFYIISIFICGLFTVYEKILICV